MCNFWQVAIFNTYTSNGEELNAFLSLFNRMFPVSILKSTSG